MPGKVSVMPGFMLHRYGQIDTHAENLARARAQRSALACGDLLAGLWRARAVYTGLATRLVTPAAASSSSRWTTPTSPL